MTPRALLTQATRAGHQMAPLSVVAGSLYAPQSSRRIDTYGATCLFPGCHATLTVRMDGVVLDASATEPCASTQVEPAISTAI